MLYYRSRRYSTTSTRQITTLDQLEAAFTAIVNNASRTRTISLSEGLLHTQLQQSFSLLCLRASGFTQAQASKLINELAQLLGDIDKFQVYICYYYYC